MEEYIFPCGASSLDIEILFCNECGGYFNWHANEPKVCGHCGSEDVSEDD